MLILCGLELSKSVRIVRKVSVIGVGADRRVCLLEVGGDSLARALQLSSIKMSIFGSFKKCVMDGELSADLVAFEVF
jgi:hypothetical protein